MPVLCPASRMARPMAVALGLAMTTVVGVSAVAVADDGTAPSREEVAAARSDAASRARDVAGVQADLVLANEQLRRSGIAAAQAAEAYNGAMWRVDQALETARDAAEAAAAAQRGVDRQQQAYSETLVRSYQQAPGVTAMAAVVQSDGIETVIERSATMSTAEEAIAGRYDEFRASATLAEAASSRAEEARQEAEAARVGAQQARDAARAAADRAATQAQAIAQAKAALVAELAQLQGISVALAARRQSALEQRAQVAAAEAARATAPVSGTTPAPAPVPEAPETQPAPPPAPAPAPAPQPAPAPEPAPEPQPAPAPAPQPAPAPAPHAGGAAAAIRFAEQQVGEPYVWGADGPGAWDCSGLTMRSWQQGGKYLPHYSVAQYEQSTPIEASRLAPGDLVFWGSSSNPSSIYHVALYVGDGQIIHAPRSGRPVTKESMYYWTPPNFHARP